MPETALPDAGEPWASWRLRCAQASCISSSLRSGWPWYGMERRWP